MWAYQLRSDRGCGSAAIDRVDGIDDVGELGPRDVRVAVRAVALNPHDLRVLDRVDRLPRPLVPLSDGAGEVVAVGREVESVGIGDRVVAGYHPTWLDGEIGDDHYSNVLGDTIDGVLRERVVLPEQAWVRVPSHLSFEEAATLPCAGVTAWHAVVVAGRVSVGDTVLVQGTGGVATFALQIARAAGAEVIAVTGSPDKAPALTRMGAATVIGSYEQPEWGERARAATGGRGVDLVVDVGGAGTLGQSLQALRYGGSVSLVGVLGGGRDRIDLRVVLAKRARLVGVVVGSVAMLRALCHVVERARIRPVIDRTFTLAETRAAFDYLIGPHGVGKVVISV